MCANESLPVRVRGESGIRPPTEWALPTPVQLELLLAAMRRWTEDGEHA
ncbi:hypothetical protein [Nocardia sp. NPDC051750]